MLAAAFCAGPSTASPAAPGDAVAVKIWAADVDRVELSRADDGRFLYTVELAGGERLTLDPDGFAALLHGRVSERPGWQRLLNISGPVGLAWVALGLIGQLAFTARMLAQWWASERAGRSVVPVVFWWLSVGGATMLLVYFVWRKDVVGVLGQSAGFFIYARNLWLIRRGRTPDVAG
jgi:lipid-A-disaccharide synthase-like uncharacterized protein